MIKNFKELPTLYGPHKVIIPYHNTDLAKDWCEKQFGIDITRWQTLFPAIFRFKNEDDSLLFALRWL